MTEPLTHNPKNAVTDSIERVPYQQGYAVRKVLNGINSPSVVRGWEASDIPSHWNYWKREALVYKSELGSRLSGTGVRLPKLLEIDESEPGKITLLLEHIDGRTGATLTISDYQTVCRGWGAAQTRLLKDDWRKPWISRQFIREYARSKSTDYRLLYDDSAWSQELIRSNWPSGLRAQLIELYEQREALYAILDASERVPSHLDYWPNNVIVTADGEVAPIDWAFFGEGAIGEDVGNFIPDAVFDGFVAPEQLPDLDRALTDAYLDGLGSSGVRVDSKQVVRSIRASAVKYVWLGPLLLKTAASQQQTAYGGAELADANEQFRARGNALSYICEWAKSSLAF